MNYQKFKEPSGEVKPKMSDWIYDKWRELLRGNNKFSDFYYWVKDSLNPYNKVKVPTLGIHWMDKDQIMLHVNFALLVDFIEGEEPFEIIDWDHNEEHRFARSEMEELYDWWVYLYPNRIEPIHETDMPDYEYVREKPDDNWVTQRTREDDPKVEPWKEAMNQQIMFDDVWEWEEQDMLHRLINIRKYLWT